ncbi:MAG: hypothetical protein JSR82_12205 [Verrucomicrobia bacterium]|nr:hypothetical protein [Verrucomicrobiota bacterium]
MKTLFVETVEVTTQSPFKPDSRVRLCASKAEVLHHARSAGLKIKEGTGEFMGVRTDWIRFDDHKHSIHDE